MGFNRYSDIRRTAFRSILRPDDRVRSTVRRFRNATLAAAMVGAASVSLVGVGSVPASGASQRVYNITISQSVTQEGNAFLYVAISKGFFVQHHLNVTLTNLASSSQDAAVLESGSVQVAADSTSTMGAAVSGGAKLLAFQSTGGIILELCARTSWAQGRGVTPNSSLTSIFQAFQGQNIGVIAPNGSPDLTMQYLESFYGHMTPSQYPQDISVGSSTALTTALEQGKIDAAWQSPPACENEIIATAGTPNAVEQLLVPHQIPLFKTFPNSILDTTVAYAKSHPAVIKDVTAAIVEAFKYEHTHVQGTINVLQTYFPTTSLATLTQTYEQVVKPEVPRIGTMTRSGWKTVSALLLPVDGAHLNTAQGIIWTNKYLP